MEDTLNDEIFTVKIELWDTEGFTDIPSRKVARSFVYERIREIFKTVEWDGLKGEIEVSIKTTP